LNGFGVLEKASGRGREINQRAERIDRHQYHAMKLSLGRVDEVGNFFGAQDVG
jgi:hypothetical protein